MATTATALSQFSSLSSTIGGSNSSKDKKKTANLSIFDLANSITENDNDTSDNIDSNGNRSASSSPRKRASDVSNYGEDNNNNGTSTTPASLAADLVHYKELFSKLRFSYHEQVTKEKFLRAVTASPPLLVDPADNAVLEQTLAQEKEVLKAQKAELSEITVGLENQARELVKRYEALSAQQQALLELPSQIAELESLIIELRNEYPEMDPNVPKEMTLGYQETQMLLEEQLRKNEDLDEEMKVLEERDIPATERELGRLEDELAQLEATKKVAVGRAKEAKRRKEEGGVDEVERRGRWSRAGEAVMKDIFT